MEGGLYPMEVFTKLLNFLNLFGTIIVYFVKENPID